MSDAPRSLRHREVEARLADALAVLDRTPGLRPLLPGEDLQFARHDLASTAETAYGDPVDPELLNPADTTELAQRLRFSLGTEDRLRRRYWITAAGRIAGTLAVDDYPIGRSSLHLSSLYLRPEHRGRGLGRTAVTSVLDAARVTGLTGVQLTADWLSPQSVAFYLHLGFHVRHWKHAIHLSRRHDGPAFSHRILAGGDHRLTATATERTLLTASRNGPWLDWTEHMADDPGIPGADTESWDARATLAVYLALAGFPLIRSPEHWAESHLWSEGGQPEGLARRIWFFEEYARRCGHVVHTPRQELPPDLTWPTWD